MKILNRYDLNIVVYESKKETIREAVIEAVEKGADLRDADLRDAELGGAELGDANLRGAELYHAHFYGRNGQTKIKKSQVEQFHEALGIVVEE